MEKKQLNKLRDVSKDLKKMMKKTDNFDSTCKRAKSEIFTNKKSHLQKDKKGNYINLKTKKEFNNNTEATNITYPSQVIIKLLSIQGAELGSDMTVPISTTTLDLNILLNKLKKEEETTSYIFLIDNQEIKTNLLDTLKKNPNFESEKIVKIIYRPESIFSVKPLTRASSTLEGHTDSILTCQFSPDGRHLASGGGDCVLRFWDTFTETPLYESRDNSDVNNISTKIASHTSHILCLSFSPDAKMLASGSIDGVFIIWDPETGLPLSRSIRAHSKWITALTWKPFHLDPECKYLLSSSKDGFIKIWNVKNQTCVVSVQAHDDSITKCIWSGENFIYTCSQDKLIKVWEETGVCVKVLKGHAHWINTMTINNEFILRTGPFEFDNENNKIALEGINEENRLTVWESAKKRYEKFKEKVNSHEKIVTGSDDFTLILWDPLNSDKPVNRMTGHQGLVNHVAFSPDTFFLASASFDKSIKLWNGHSGEYISVFRGHVGPIYTIAWSPDSRLLLSGSKDSTIKCWNAKLKRLMFDLPGHADEVYCVDWSPDGEKAVSGSKDRRLRIWKN